MLRDVLSRNSLNYSGCLIDITVVISIETSRDIWEGSKIPEGKMVLDSLAVVKSG